MQICTKNIGTYLRKIVSSYFGDNMKKFKYIALFATFIFVGNSLFAQADEDLFGDDGIEEVNEVSAKSDLSKGSLFENGSVKIGGSLGASISTTTTLFDKENGKNIGENIKDTKLSPSLSSFLSVDARPTQTLRMYTKFGIAYPFEVKAITTPGGTSVKDWFTLKEMFTDFSFADRVFFRFGLHTVTWGTGYFFSPVSDVINTSSIDPENPTEQVNGALNLRAQITFPDSRNCVWLYVIPSTDFAAGTVDSYARSAGLAGKYEFVLGGWELGVGGFWKYQNAPKAMVTASGSVKKVSLFGEVVYQYGALSEWQKNTNWNGKTSILQATAGLSYYWKDPQINLMGQYYFDGNKKDFAHELGTYGHNIALNVSFGKLGNAKNLTATVFAMANFGKHSIDDALSRTDLSAEETMALNAAKLSNNAKINHVTASAMLNYSPFDNFSISAGPNVSWEDYNKVPVTSLKLTVKLGGGKF